MTKRSTRSQFIKRARQVHGNKYDYSKVKYVNATTKVIIICSEHGEFSQIPNGHNSGKGCKKCSHQATGNRLRGNTKNFIKRARQVHGNKYDYSKVEYKDSYTKVIIICPYHGDFFQFPHNHIKEHGCRKCFDDKISKKLTLTTDQFIRQSKEVHGNKYDYSKVEYKDSYTKVIIICPYHGDFLQGANGHKNGNGCRKCSELIIGDRRRKTLEEFIVDARKTHGNRYNYGKVEYINCDTKIIIRCPDHGDFLQTPDNHIRGKGCPTCRQSKGEEIIRVYLDKRGIKYIQQYKLPYKGVSNRKYDFFLADYNMIIEFDGVQHFKFIKHYHRSLDKFGERRLADVQKTSYVVNNGHRLVRIDYKSINRITQIMRKILANPKKIYLSDRNMYRELMENLLELSPNIARKLLNRCDFI